MQLRLFRHALVDSTNERAFDALRAATARHGDVHVAQAQSAGRGRLGRTWHSPDHAGLYLSLILLPPPPPLSPAALTMAAGLAALEGVRELFARANLAPPALRLDWPNDLLANDAKLAGVLVETRGLDAAAPHYVVGVGLNVRNSTFPPELLAERAVTSLAACGLDASVAAAEECVLASLARRLAALHAPHDALARDFLAALALADERVRVVASGVEHTGRLLELDLEHGLALELAGARRLVLPLEFVQQVARA